MGGTDKIVEIDEALMGKNMDGWSMETIIKRWKCEWLDLQKD